MDHPYLIILTDNHEYWSNNIYKIKLIDHIKCKEEKFSDHKPLRIPFI